jgi:hypothetical protein
VTSRSGCLTLIAVVSGITGIERASLSHLAATLSIAVSLRSFWTLVCPISFIAALAALISGFITSSYCSTWVSLKGVGQELIQLIDCCLVNGSVGSSNRLQVPCVRCRRPLFIVKQDSIFLLAPFQGALDIQFFFYHLLVSFVIREVSDV